MRKHYPLLASLLLALLVALPARAQYKKVGRWLEQGEFGKAKTALQKQEHKAFDQAEYTYSWVLYYLHTNNPEHDIDKAHTLLGTLEKQFQAASPKTQASWQKEGFTTDTIARLQQQCDQSAYTTAKAQNTLAAWQHFISTYPQSPRRTLAERRQDSLAYYQALQAGQAQAFGQALEHHELGPWRPQAQHWYDSLSYVEHTADSNWRHIANDYLPLHHDSPYYPKAKALMEWLRYRDETSAETFAAYDAFVRLYPESTYFPEAEAQLEYARFMKYAAEGQGHERFMRYIQEYPNSYYRRMAEDSVFRLLTHPPSLAKYTAFVTNTRHQDNRNIEKAWRSLYRLFNLNGSPETLEAFQEAFPQFPFREMLRLDLLLAQQQDVSLFGKEDADLVALSPGDSVPLTVINNLKPSATVTRNDTNGRRVRLNLQGIYNPETGAPVELTPQQNIFIIEDSIPVPLKVIKVSKENVLSVDLVFTIDVSGSMDEEQERVQEGVAAFAEELEAKGLAARFALVLYDDHGRLVGAQDFGAANGIADYLEDRHHHHHHNRQSLAVSAYHYGANGDECGVKAIQFARQYFTYRPDAQKVFINFTDEPNQPHYNGDYSVDRMEEMTDATIHTVWSGDVEEFSWRPLRREEPWKMSELTGGMRLDIDENAEDLDLGKLPIITIMANSYLVEFASQNPNQAHTLKITVKDIDADGTVIYENITYDTNDPNN